MHYSIGFVLIMKGRFVYLLNPYRSWFCFHMIYIDKSWCFIFKVKLLIEYKGVLPKVLFQVRQVMSTIFCSSTSRAGIKLVYCDMNCCVDVCLLYSTITQVYERFDVPSIAEADDARLDYFTRRVSLTTFHLYFQNWLRNAFFMVYAYFI